MKTPASAEGMAWRLLVLQWCHPYIAYPQYSTRPNVARRARSRRAKSLGLPMPLCGTRLNVACYVRASHATSRVTPLYRGTSLVSEAELQGYLAHKKLPPPRTLQWAYAQGPTVVLGKGAVSYGRGNSVGIHFTVNFIDVDA